MKKLFQKKDRWSYLIRRLKRAVLPKLALRWRPFLIFLPDSAPLAVKKHEYRAHSMQKTLLVFLPGINNIVEDYQTHGFIDMVRDMDLEADMIVVDAHYGYYATRTLVDRLKRDVIEPHRKLGYQNIWLIGISLGGLGALLYAMDYPEDIKGVTVFAPFLGMEYHKQITAAGGLAEWDTSLAAGAEWEFRLWQWLKQYLDLHERLPLFLLCGDEDIFAPAHKLLSAALPAEQVYIIPGGHLWRTWKQLWLEFLQKNAAIIMDKTNSETLHQSLSR